MGISRLKAVRRKCEQRICLTRNKEDSTNILKCEGRNGDQILDTNSGISMQNWVQKWVHEQVAIGTYDYIKHKGSGTGR
jgi:hypothetical protein